MSDVEKTKQTEKEPKLGFTFPWAAVVWLVIGMIIFMLGTQVVTMRDQERFANDFELQAEPVDEPNTVKVKVVAGTFEYDVVPEIPNTVEIGTFSPDTDNPVASVLYKGIPDATEISINTQTITITYDSDTEADLILRQAQRPMINAVLNEGSTIEGTIADDAENALVFTTTDPEWRYGQYVASLIPAGKQEVYVSRVEGENGSELAQFIFNYFSAIEALTINPDSLIVTYREGAVEKQVINRIQDALNDFYPRSSLQVNLWVFSVSTSSAKLLKITPINTGFPLIIFILIIPVIELAAQAYFQKRNDKLVIPLIRVTSVFLLCWSIYGHEPLWDYVLGLIFPTSNQLIHPSATVIQFTAQHLELVFVSSLITIPAGLLFGILVTREGFREVLPLVNNLVNSGQPFLR